MTWSFANQGRRFQIWHFRLEILTPWPHYPQNSQILLYKYCFFAWNTHCCRRHTCTCATKFLHHLGTGCFLPKTTFRTKIWGGCARGASKKLGPLRISATVEASNSKFGTQLGFGTSLPKKQRLGPKLAGSGPGVHPKKLVPCGTDGRRLLNA